jgi:hypothetical protein
VSPTELTDHYLQRAAYLDPGLVVAVHVEVGAPLRDRHPPGPVTVITGP